MEQNLSTSLLEATTAMEARTATTSSFDFERDKPGLLSDELTKTLYVTNFVILNCLICCFGLVSNALNMAVYRKQGLREASNVSFFGLSVSDFCMLVFQLWMGVIEIPRLVTSSDLGVFLSELTYVIGRPQRSALVRTSVWITVFITLQRCACVVKPLKVKALFTLRRTRIFIVACALFFMLNSIPLYLGLDIGNKFIPKTNTSRLGVIKKAPTILSGTTVFTSMFFQLFSLCAIVLSNIVLLCAMRQRRYRLRHLVSGLSDQGAFEMSSRVGAEAAVPPADVAAFNRWKKDKKMNKMVLLLSSLQLVSFTPSAIAFMVSLLEPKITPTGRYKNVFDTVWGFVVVLEALNASINIVWYYSMSSRYKSTINEMFGWGTGPAARSGGGHGRKVGGRE
ncbi:chemosensory receptor b [Plakobranchus ocellatus]|uniref:Chemosensory receptor b n=1 Tax=Plakobranchus ocellatus TaxID=259542 RepID=A0AAV3ZFR6_9GAST|nr:chemosensory receptor b [Plakobranchus ocellatus]